MSYYYYYYFILLFIYLFHYLLIYYFIYLFYSIFYFILSFFSKQQTHSGLGSPPAVQKTAVPAAAAPPNDNYGSIPKNNTEQRSCK